MFALGRGLSELVVFFGASLVSVLSCVLLAELAVGRVILAKKPSSGPDALVLLGRGVGLVAVELALASEPRVDAVGGFALFVDARSGFRGAGLVAGGGFVAGLGSSCLAADAAVGAVR